MNHHVERVLRHADRDERGCLISRYSAGSHGYAQAWDGSTVVLAHRLIWVSERGPIPDGMTVDHRDHCNRKCIEITHLRLLDNWGNARLNRPDGDTETATCINGHDAPVLEKHRGGKVWRTCSQCNKDRNARANAAARERKNGWRRQKRAAERRTS